MDHGMELGGSCHFQASLSAALVAFAASNCKCTKRSAVAMAMSMLAVQPALRVGSCSKRPFMTCRFPWEWYIYTYIWLNFFMVNVAKYNIPYMDPVGDG